MSLSIIIIFDMSGSMQTMMHIKPTVIDTINEFIDLQKSEQLDDTCDMSLYFFNDEIKEVFYKKSLKSIEHISEKDYTPRDTTSLLDAIGNIIKKFENQQDIFMAIVTDGEENSSEKFSLSEIHNLIKNKKKSGWKFKFFGSNQDSWSSGQKLGLNKTDCVNYHATSAALRNVMCSATTQEINSLRTPFLKK